MNRNSVWLLAVLASSGLGACGDDDAPPVEPPEDTAVADSTTSDVRADVTTDTRVDSVADSAIADTADGTIADTADSAITDTITDTAADTTDAADVTDTRADSGDSAVTCGSAPYTRTKHNGAVATNHPSGPVTVTGSTCPASSVSFTPILSPPAGAGTDGFMDVPDEVAIYFRGSQTGAFPALTPELLPDNSSLAVRFFGFTPVQWITFPLDYPFTTAVDPAWDPATKGVLYLVTVKNDAATAPCNTTAGVVYTVTGHPETVVKYEGGGTSTSTFGHATATVVTTGTYAAPEMLTIVGTKAGCTVKLALGSQTGKFPIAIGSTTGTVIAEVNN